MRRQRLDLDSKSADTNLGRNTDCPDAFRRLPLPLPEEYRDYLD
jgi:hypothetical protein